MDPQPSCPPSASNSAAARHPVREALAELEGPRRVAMGAAVPLDRLLELPARRADLARLLPGRLDAADVQVEVLGGGQLKPWVASAA